MTDERKPMANITPFGLRMQPNLKAMVEEAARANNRSLNAEIVTRIEAAEEYQQELRRLMQKLGEKDRQLRVVHAKESTLEAERDAAKREVEVLREEYAALHKIQMNYQQQAKFMELIADTLNTIDTKLDKLV